MAEVLTTISWPAYARSTWRRFAVVAAKRLGRRPSLPRPKALAERWRDALSALALASAVLVFLAAGPGADLDRCLMLVYAASCAARARNPIAWGSLPHGAAWESAASTAATSDHHFSDCTSFPSSSGGETVSLVAMGNRFLILRGVPAGNVKEGRSASGKVW